MTKKQQKRGMTDGEFEALVDEQFNPSAVSHKGGQKPIPIPDVVFDELAHEGFDPRLTKTGAAFNALMARCIGKPVTPLTADSAKFINDFDAEMRDFAGSRGIELRDK